MSAMFCVGAVVCMLLGGKCLCVPHAVGSYPARDGRLALVKYECASAALGRVPRAVGDGVSGSVGSISLAQLLESTVWKPELGARMEAIHKVDDGRHGRETEPEWEVHRTSVRGFVSEIPRHVISSEWVARFTFQHDEQGGSDLYFRQCPVSSS
ncbi:hypothetical protein FKP32DRAFT_1212203 [Trametes sanguinea]|nr:hypothetical protein FKP32DRAFT_1212203 [Trametes sanguinea]